MVRRLSFIAPTGYGKTTAARLVASICPDAVNIKLATPIYELQEYFYAFIGVPMRGEQDGELLQFLGYKINKEAPAFLLTRFRQAFARIESHAVIITNDDCRPPNHECLRELGFLFVRIDGFPRVRQDHTKIDPDHPLERGLLAIECDYVLNNRGDMEVFKREIERMLKAL